jgi:spore maturation protein SpmB
MCYMFLPHTAFFRQHAFKEPTSLCTLSIVLLKYVVVIIINFDVIGCLFFLSFVLRPLCAPLGVPLSWLYVSCVDLCSLTGNRHRITSKLIIITTTYFKSTIYKVHSAVDSLKACFLKMVLCGRNT